MSNTGPALTVGPFASSQSGGADGIYANPSGQKRKHGQAYVPGLYAPPPDAAPATRQQIQSNSNWVQIPTACIQRALNFFDRDEYIKDAVSIKLNHVLGGGITFHRETNEMSAEEQIWHNQTYCDYATELYRYTKALGFACVSVLPHANPKYIGEPILQDLSRVEIYLLMDAWRRPHLKLFLPQVSGASGANDLEIPNLRVIWTSKPTFTGVAGAPSVVELQSIDLLLGGDRAQDTRLREYMDTAAEYNCFPPVASELHTVQNESLPLYSSYSGGGGAHINAPDTSVDRQKEREYMLGVQREHQIQLMRHINSGGNARQGSAIAQHTGRNLALMQNQLFIPNERNVVRINEAKEPTHVLEFSQQRRDKVYSYFSIPPGVVTPTGGAGAGNKATSAASVNSMTVFMNDQKRLKNWMIVQITEMYQQITQKKRWFDSFKEGLAEGVVKKAEQVKYETETVIELPGVPQPEILMDYWLAGILNYDFLCDTLASVHGFPTKRAFNKKPALDLEDLAGIKPDPPDGPGGSKKKQKR